MSILTVKQPFTFRGFNVPEAFSTIDWVSFDRGNKIAQITLGIYRNAEETSDGANKLESVQLVFKDEEYDNLLASYPEIFSGIVLGVYELAAEHKPEIFELE